MAITEKFVGQSVLRKEDASLLTGQGSFVDNLTVPGMLHLAVVRSPFAHARIVKVDVSKAREMPGVVGAWSGDDLAGEWAGPLPMVWPITEDIKTSDHWPITKDKARFQGDGVAVVVAESRGLADDAAEVVAVEYEQLTPVLDLEGGAEEGSPLVHDELGTNAVVHWSHGGGGDQDVFDTAPVQLRLRYEAPRITPSPIEGRGALASVVPAMGEFTLWTSSQIPHIARVTLSGTTGIPEHKLRIVAPDVGGAFGAKLNVYAEEALCLALARRTGRAVKWIEDRSVSYAVTAQGRGVIHDVEVAATEEGKLLGLRVKELADMGAYFQLLTPGIPELGGWVYMGPYDPQGYWYEFTGVMTNKAPTDAVRGAGRPEATYVVERAVDALARHVGKDPAEVRRISFAPSHAEAKPSLMGLQIDSADYLPAFERALELADYDQYRKEQASRRESREVKQIGIGLSSYIEMSGLAPSNILGALRYAAGGWEAAQVRCQPSGKVTLNIGTSPHGQGHDTVWSQIAADELGVHPDDVEVLHGDTSISPLGMDTYGSRSISIGGAALVVALQKIKDKARTLAAHELEVAEDDLEFRDGAFRVQGAPDKVRTIPELAVSAWTAHDLPDGYEPDLTAIATWDPKNFTWPFGTHVCIAEVDTETGATQLLRYVAVDDCGVVMNPAIVDGQVHGGVAFGIAEALYEEILYDEHGNLVTGTLTQYLVPSAVEMPSFELDRTVTPSPTNPLGVKGIGEAGTIAAPPAVVNAIVDAVSHLGVTDVGKPATPERVWRAIRDAKGGCGMIPAPFEYKRADSVDEAIRALAGEPEAKLLAGGHSLLPLMKLRLARPSLLVDISRLQDLKYIKQDGDAVAIGALTRHHDVANSEVLQELCPIVSYAAGEIGDPQVRHVGTIGGSVAHADPASDMPTVLVALGAEMVVRGPGGVRGVAAGEFFKGLFEPDLATNEVLTEIRVPKTADRGWSYLKFHRRAQDWALVGVAALAQNGAGPAVALTNMSDRPVRATGVEEELAGGADPAAAAQRAAEGTSPPTDAFASAEYRQELVKVLVRRALEEAQAR